jgi:hypothetical protein
MGTVSWEKVHKDHTKPSLQHTHTHNFLPPAALLIAAYAFVHGCGELSTIKLLRDAGGMVVIFCESSSFLTLPIRTGCDINQGNLAGQTPLACAASEGNCGLINYLIHLGASKSKKATRNASPHRIAREFHHREAEGLLVYQ